MVESKIIHFTLSSWKKNSDLKERKQLLSNYLSILISPKDISAWALSIGLICFNREEASNNYQAHFFPTNYEVNQFYNFLAGKQDSAFALLWTRKVHLKFE